MVRRTVHILTSRLFHRVLPLRFPSVLPLMPVYTAWYGIAALLPDSLIPAPSHWSPNGGPAIPWAAARSAPMRRTKTLPTARRWERDPRPLRRLRSEERRV